MQPKRVQNATVTFRKPCNLTFNLKLCKYANQAKVLHGCLGKKNWLLQPSELVRSVVTSFVTVTN